MNPWTVVPDHVVLALGWTLLHFLWQGTLVAVLLAIASRAFDRGASGPRYLLATAALLAMVALPAATFVRLSSDFAPKAPAIESAPAALVAGSAAVQVPQVFAWSGDAGEPAMAGDPAIESMAATDVATGTPTDLSWEVVRAGNDPDTFAFEARPAPPPAALHSLWLAVQTLARTALRMGTAALERTLDRNAPIWLPWFVALWGLGVMLLTLRLAGGWVITRRIRRTVIDIPGDRLHETLERLTARMRVSRPVRAFRSALVEVPTVIGWLRPVILVPVGAMAGLTPAQVEALVAHELAHIRRHDYLINLLQTVVETILFYHPAVWWVSHCVREERENACDDLAVRACGDRVAYARALCDLEHLRLAAPRLALAANGGSLLNRIRRLLDPAPRASLVSRCGACLLLLGSILFVVLGLAPAARSQHARSASEDGFFSVVASFTGAPPAPPAPPAPAAPAAPDAVPAPAPRATPAPGEVMPPPAAPFAAPAAPAVPATPAPEAPCCDAAPVPPREHLHLAPLPGGGLHGHIGAAAAPEAAPCPPAPGCATQETCAPAAPRPAPAATPGGRWTVAPVPSLAHLAESVQNTQRQVERTVRQVMRKDLTRVVAQRKRAEAVARTANATAYAYSVTMAPAAPNARRIAEFREALAAAGVDDLDDEHLDVLFAQGVSADYVAAISEALGDTPGAEDLLGLKLMGVAPDYARAMRDALGDEPEAEELIALKVQSVTPDYVRAMREAVQDAPDAEELIELKLHGVTPDEARTLARVTDEPLDAETLLELRTSGVSSAYARAIAERMGRTVELDELADLRRRNVTPEQIDALQRLGIGADEQSLVELRSHGISLGDVAQMRRLRGHDLSLDQLIELHDSGVTPDVVAALNVLGYRDLSEDEMVELARAGVTLDWVAQMTSAFGRPLGADELMALHQNAVNVVYAANMARLQGVKFGVDDIVALHRAAVPSAYVSAVVATGYADRSPEAIAMLHRGGVRTSWLAVLVKAGGADLEPEEVVRRFHSGISAAQIERAQRNGEDPSADTVIEFTRRETSDCEQKAKDKK